MAEEKIAEKIHTLPVLPLRGFPVFPDMIIQFDVVRDKSIAAIEKSSVQNQLIFLAPQRNPDAGCPIEEDIYPVGTIARIKQVLRIGDNDVRVLVEGIIRGEVLSCSDDDSYIECTVRETRSLGSEDEQAHITADAYMKNIKNLCAGYSVMSGKATVESAADYMDDDDPGHFSDKLAAAMPFFSKDKIKLLEQTDVIKRLEMLVEMMENLIENKKMSDRIEMRTKQRLSKTQREFYLREKLRVVREELGETDAVSAEIDDYLTKLEEKCVPDFVLEKAKKELDKLHKMQNGNPEGAVIRDYVQWLTDLPWTEKTNENSEIELAQHHLDKDHYGMKDVKERILEFISVRKISGGKKAPILCLVGPPGVGKTSVAKSIAKALGRKYVRLSLGGIRDEADIRGHRKTYVGAMPGRIITAMKQAGVANPLILLDEIDKISADYRGNPSAALLEVLDSAQNFSFRDHYIELDYDLSDVLFVTTANSLDTVDRPLLDRMEVIELSGYTDAEKAQIAMKHLIPRLFEEHGMKKSMIKFSKPAILDIINGYTRESGVRELERKIEKIFRKAAKMIEADGAKSVSVTKRNLESLLGKRIYLDTEKRSDEVGVATGLAWTQYGGDILYIEAEVMDGGGSVELTGQLGDVMKESAKAAVTYIRANSDKFGIDREFYKNNDIHIHVPEGAVPKDGPSAGITMTTALVSALSGRKVTKDVAMTGEITITGKILPIGGLKEKSLAAHRMGIKKVLIPAENRRDLEEIPEEIRDDMQFITADSMETVINNALL